MERAAHSVVKGATDDAALAKAILAEAMTELEQERFTARSARTLHRTLQVLSVHPFEKVTLNELLTENDHRTFIDSDPNQLNLF